LQLVRENPQFVNATASVHPSYLKKLKQREVETYIHEILNNRQDLVAIGETGIDYNWVKDPEGRAKQKEVFVQFISLANQLKLPLVIHSRSAAEDTIEILEQSNARNVQMHMFTQHSQVQRVIDNDWFIYMNTTLLKSKSLRKIARDTPLELLLLETDSPWLGIDTSGHLKPRDEVRNEPLNVHRVAKKIGEIKKIDVLEVDKQTTVNAKKLFNIAN
ncbi:MAG: TatD family hydrolase, partial [Candidatus Bathyarchaeota archaeon]